MVIFFLGASFFTVLPTPGFFKQYSSSFKFLVLVKVGSVSILTGDGMYQMIELTWDLAGVSFNNMGTGCWC